MQDQYFGRTRAAGHWLNRWESMLDGTSRSGGVEIGVLKALHLLKAGNKSTTLDAICDWLTTTDNFYYDDWLTVGGRSRRLNVRLTTHVNDSLWPGCDFRRAPHFAQSRDANATVVASQAGAQAHPPAVRYLSNGHRNFPVLRRAERLPPACIAPTGIRTGLCARRDGQAHDGSARRPAYRGRTDPHQWGIGRLGA